jgi:predicted phosphodiesterase
MAGVATAIVSDLHLGTTSGVDLARRPEALERLLGVLAGADRIVFLGDLLELRERPAGAVLEDLAPVLRQLGEAAGGKQVTIVAGNHDHQLVGPAIERARLANGRPLGVAGSYPPAPGELAGHLIDLLPGSEVDIAYPGVWLRDDVYATHGHYLDVHLTVPRVECLIAAAVERYATDLGPEGPTSPAGYEAILSPIYALAHAVAQSTRAHRLTNSSGLSRRVWSSAAGRGTGGKLTRAVVGRGAIPLAVAAINLAGLGPFKPDISGEELRRAGLAAIGEVVGRLGIDADYVVFGHTHRAGPLDRDTAGWTLPGGTDLVNTGSWIYEDVFFDGDGRANPYWPGRVAILGEQGPPELRSLLDGLDLARLLH